MDAWCKAAGLSRDHACAVVSQDTAEAERVLRELYAVADEWKHHPDYPHAPAVSQPV
ncbi:hypothetical protein ACIQVO_38380 [Streptomyces sp. NPDC101062]|uniref:hypothetical protein n=1 Tax=unclassified Streptomyces TaxID=2593676 RepID=UPI00380936F4